MTKKMFFNGIFLVSGLVLAQRAFSAADPNFHIYLAFGQSNMEGQGIISTDDQTVDSRFQVIAAVTCSNLSRTEGSWYTAVPPLFRCYTGLSPADYFGRTLVESLPSTIKVGVVPVAIAGCKIELFDKDNYESYADTAETWMQSIISAYGGNPYGRLVELAQQAQEVGVIKGILLHQGESNVGDSEWLTKVKKIYHDLLTDLNLDSTQVPLLAGEVVRSEQGGICSGANSLIDQLPSVIATAHVIPSTGCTDTSDNLHFNAAGYRVLGKRYADTMLTLLDTATSTETSSSEMGSSSGTSSSSKSVWLEAECGTVGSNWQTLNDADASNDSYVTVQSGLNSTSSAPTGSDDAVSFSFSVDAAGSYNVYARINCTSADDDSYWIKMDDGSFETVNQLTTSGWEWKTFEQFDLTAGDHTLTVAYREDGAELDKINITTSSSAPTDLGESATCPTTVISSTAPSSEMLFIHQIHSGASSATLVVSLEIPNTRQIDIGIYSMRGERIGNLAGEALNAGHHEFQYTTGNLPQGMYLVTVKSGKTSINRLFTVGM
ncbi:MAG TPA: sialate O-acetylesterase [Fibrobacteraceae bacterium]|nr:sialate O-acetylesterase [Fibrobacteraceae bacterium]